MSHIETVRLRLKPTGLAASDRIYYLDGLRGIAAISVALFFHYSAFTNLFQPGALPLSAAPGFDLPFLNTIYRHGDVAVDMFFMISGFIFSMVYGEAVSRRRVSAWKFAVYRFARLYPIHLLTLLVTCLLIGLFEARTGHDPVYVYNGVAEFVLNVLFLQNGTFERGFSFNGPAWSLSIEAMMYAIFFVVAARQRCIAGAGVAIAVGLILFWPGVSHTWRPMLLSINVARGLVGFFLGMLIHGIGAFRPLIMAIVVVVIGAGTVLYTTDPAPPVTWIGFGLLLLALQKWQILRRPFEIWPLRKLGDLSISVYMVHFPLQVVILLMLDLLHLPIPTASVGFITAYGMGIISLAWLTHTWFELPMQELLRRRLTSPSRAWGSSEPK